MTAAEPLPDDAAPLLEEFDEEEAGVRLRDRQGLILVLILAVYLLGGLGERWSRALGVLVFVGVMLLALWVPGLPPLMRRIGAPLSLLLLAVAVPLMLADSKARGVGYLLVAAVQVLVFVAILARLAQHSRVNVQTVMGALAAYVMIGFIAASIYQATDLLASQPFFGESVPQYDFLYFSFVTLTTTGYGDLTAATAIGKRMVVVEALLGQIFLLTLVARLVAIWGQPLGRYRNQPDGESAPGESPPDR